jgi:hypothetical protein
MSIKVRTLFIWVLSIGVPGIMLACNCEVRNSFNFRDWNDTPIIFKAILSDYVRTNQFIKLSFSEIDVVKGKFKDDVTIYVKTNESHTLIHGINTYQRGDTWLVFAEQENIGNKRYIRLVDSEDSAFCALSRPIHAQNDALLTYIDSISNFKQKEIVEDTYNLRSIGNLRRGLPHGTWRYEYHSGTICIMEYRRGVKHGHELYFNKNQKGHYYKIKEVLFKYNTKQYLKTYHTNGMLSECIVYGAEENFLLRFRSGHLIGKWVYHKTSDKTTAYLNKKNSLEVFDLEKPIKELR